MSPLCKLISLAFVSSSAAAGSSAAAQPSDPFGGEASDVSTPPSDTRLGQLFLGAEEPPDDLAAIFQLDVFEYYKLGDRYDTDLKRAVFQKSDEYVEKLAQMKAEKRRLQAIDLFIVADDDDSHELSSYDVKRRGFWLSLGINATGWGYEASGPRSCRGINFPALSTTGTPFLGWEAPRGIKAEMLFIPMRPEKALAVEQSKGDAHVFFFFRLGDVREVRFKAFEEDAWRNVRQELPAARFVRVVVANSRSGETYFEKLFGKEP
jgi:hypothetical protein